ncbi:MULTISPECIES: type II toxin-antitoxin system Phd/YefM family antitoxin [unclassified Adlercreutzia]|uniref:type II toxin-antitoxin system Phd/YefM family antitoxin n=1 Tax=unclassified Adlercreutzia TaxID=2636013 RepID=UPI0013EC467A|nr:MULTISPECIES: type II toxin-antitoxin system Phd/YefM family antitoxin [unclassified Adlercreutzia]
MPCIIPSTDLRNNFSDIEELAKKTREPIYLTKNGRGSLVLMDINAFEEYQDARAYRHYIDTALAEAKSNKLDGKSKYYDIEFAFEKLLDEEDPETSLGVLDATA